jgi:8-oxo-dGTP pyrophosphatase MutT (NUDIX family)
VSEQAVESDGLRIREAARALVVSPDEHVLLVRFEFPTATVWAAPGGGLEQGEDHVSALRRELAEEVGLIDPEIGPHVWTRLHVIPFLNGLWDGQRERYHLVRVPERFEPAPRLTRAQLEAEFLFEIRWFHLAELHGLDTPDTPDTGRPTHLRPTGFVTHLRTLLRDGPPAVPLDVPV